MVRKSPVDTCMVPPESRGLRVYVQPVTEWNPGENSVVPPGAFMNAPYAAFPWFFVCQERNRPYRTFRICVFARNEATARTLIPESVADPRQMRILAISRGDYWDTPVTHVIKLSETESVKGDKSNRCAV